MDGLTLDFECYDLIFNKPVGTSRGILVKKPSWILSLRDKEKMGQGECSVIPNLSKDFFNHKLYESKLNELKMLLLKYCIADFEFLNDEVRMPEKIESFLMNLPSIRFGIEMALFSMRTGVDREFFRNDFFLGSKKIPINGLVWMDSISMMSKSIEDLIERGFKVIKIKIGALDFEKEIQLLNEVRNKYGNHIELRVDANGAFAPQEIEIKLQKLVQFNLHSIEQPIKPGLHSKMRKICEERLVPIALDEELIGVENLAGMEKLVLSIKPQYLVLKPSLHGGFKGVKKWINLAEENKIGWWITSALESNLGLEAIAQFTSNYDLTLAQGLGTGSIYKNNLSSNLIVENGYLTRK